MTIQVDKYKEKTMSKKHVILFVVAFLGSFIGSFFYTVYKAK